MGTASTVWLQFQWVHVLRRASNRRRAMSPPSKQSTIIHSFGGSLLRKRNKWWNGIAIANTHFPWHNQIKYFLDPTLSKSKSISITLSIWLLIISIYVNYGAVHCTLRLGRKKNTKLTMEYRACGFTQWKSVIIPFYVRGLLWLLFSDFNWNRQQNGACTGHSLSSVDLSYMHTFERWTNIFHCSD